MSNLKKSRKFLLSIPYEFQVRVADQFDAALYALLPFRLSYQ
ncbi:MAG TPA: hypothetical protein VIM81_10585 [Gammaproteobacteria bacterium]